MPLLFYAIINSLIAQEAPRMSRKEKLTISEQILYMQNHCGIKFEICEPEYAEKFLNESTYFFKVKAFAKDYAKDRYTGKYRNLDFAYLRELSLLDAYLRKDIISIAVDVEHFLKATLIKDMSGNPNEDGYSIMDEFFQKYPHIREEIQYKARNSYCHDLVNKMESEGYAVWNAVEVLSFGQLSNLYKLYSTRNNGWNCKICNLLFPAKSIRNAAAHNNCILNSLQHPYSAPQSSPQITKQIDSYISHIPELKKSKSRKTKLSNPVIHDFIALLFLFDKVCTSERTKFYTYHHLYKHFHGTFTRNASYFENNATILSAYEFVVKVIDFFYNSVYNSNEEQKSI